MAVEPLFSPDTDPMRRQVGAPAESGYLDPRLVQINKWIASAEPKVLEWRKLAKESYRFRDNKQLSEEDEKALRDQGRPVAAFNQVQKFIRYVSGVQRESPLTLLFNAVDFDNTQAQLYGEQIGRYHDWAMHACNAESEIARAFEDMLVTGMGWTETFISRAKDARGLVVVSRLNPQEMLYPDCDKVNLGNSDQGCTRWRARETWIENEELFAMFSDPYARFLIENGGSDGAPYSQTWPQVDRVLYKIPYVQTYPIDQQVGASRQRKKDKSRVMQFQWWENEAGYVFEDPLDQTEQWMKEDEFEEYRKQLGAFGVSDIENYDRQIGRKWKRAFILNRRHFLADPDDEDEDTKIERFTFNCMCCHFDEDARLWYGFMRAIMDPQRFANKFFSQVIELYGRGSKGGAIASESAFADKAQMTDFINNYARPGNVNIVQDPSQIKEKEFADLPNAATALLKVCEDEMEKITGISEQSLGLGAATQAGTMMKRRQRAGMVLLACEFDAETDFRREEGYIVFDHLKLISDDRLVRVGGTYDDDPVIRLSQAPFSLQYEIEIDEIERDPNLRQWLAELVLGPFGQTAQRTGHWLPEFYNVLPIPRRWIEKIKQRDEQQQQQAQQFAAMGLPPPGGRGQKKSIPMQMAEVDNKKAQTLLAQAKAASLSAKGKQDTMKLILDALREGLEARQAQMQPQNGNGNLGGVFDVQRNGTGQNGMER